MRNRTCRNYGQRRVFSLSPKKGHHGSGIFAAVRAPPGRRGAPRCLSKERAQMWLVGESASQRNVALGPAPGNMDFANPIVPRSSSWNHSDHPSWFCSPRSRRIDIERLPPDVAGHLITPGCRPEMQPCGTITTTRNRALFQILGRIRSLYRASATAADCSGQRNPLSAHPRFRSRLPLA